MSNELDGLDRFAAEKIMGWRVIPGPLSGGDTPYTMTRLPTEIWDGPEIQIQEWQPTRNISQAWECLEKIRTGFCEVLFSAGAKKWVCSVEVKTTDGWDEFRQDAATAPEAIVRACLAAKGVEVNRELFRE